MKQKCSQLLCIYMMHSMVTLEQVTFMGIIEGTFIMTTTCSSVMLHSQHGQLYINYKKFIAVVRKLTIHYKVFPCQKVCTIRQFYSYTYLHKKLASICLRITPTNYYHAYLEVVTNSILRGTNKSLHFQEMGIPKKFCHKGNFLVYLRAA